MDRRPDGGAGSEQQPDPGDSFFIILNGEVIVSRNSWKLTTLATGVTLGEMTYLQPDHSVRSATAIAGWDIEALAIRNDSLRNASEELQACFDKAFIKLLVNRLVDTTARIGAWDILAGPDNVRLWRPSFNHCRLQAEKA